MFGRFSVHAELRCRRREPLQVGLFRRGICWNFFFYFFIRVAVVIVRHRWWSVC